MAERLTESQEKMLRFVTFEGEVCGHQLEELERKACTSLVRLGLLRSDRCRHCTAPHYRPTN